MAQYTLDPAELSSKYIIPTQSSIDDTIVGAEDLAKRLTLAHDINADAYQVGLNTTVTDADTIAGSRVTGYDAFESTADLGMNTKAKKLADMGIPIAEQKKLGLQGKEELLKWLATNQGTLLQREGTDVYGRPLIGSESLSQYMVESGTAVPSNRYDEKLQSTYRAKQEKMRLTDPVRAEAMEIQRAYNIDAQQPSMTGRLGEAVDAFQSGTQQAIAGTADFVLDVLTPGNNTLLDKLKSSEYADKIWGYDSRESNFQKKEALHNFKNEKYVDAVLGMATSPELWGESLPMIAEMAIGAGKFTTLSKVMKKATVGLKGAEKIAEAKRIRDGATAMEKATLLGAENVGFLGAVGDQTNRHIEEFTINNNGVEPTASQVVGMTAMNVLQLGLDRMAFGQLIGTKGGIQALKDTVEPLLKVVPEESLGSIAKKVATTATGITSAMGIEAGQEYLQTWAEMLNTKAGTTKYGDWEAVLGNPDVQDEAIIGMLAGAGMGAQMRGAAEIPTALGVVNTGLNKLAETSTGKTVESIDAKKAAEEQITDKLNKIVESRMVPLTDDMSVEQIDAVEAVDKKLESLYTLDRADPEYTAKVGSILQEVDTIRSEVFGITTEPTTTTPVESIETDTETSTVDTPVTKVEYQDAEVEEKANRAGIVNTLTRSDKIKEIRLESLNADTHTANASTKKNKLLSTMNVDDSVTDMILEGKANENNIASLTNVTDGNIVNFAKRVGMKLSPTYKEGKVYNALKNMSDKVNKTITENVEAKKAMEDLFGDKVSPARAVRVIALAVDTVHSAMRSEYDINQKYRIKNNTVAEARRQEVAHQLGKELVNSYELRIAGKPEETAKAYIEIGEKMLTVAEKSGMVQTGLKDVALHNMHDMEGNRLTAEEAKTYYGQGKKKGTVQVPTVKVTGITSTERGAYTDEVTAANTMSKLFKPINYELPTQIFVDEVPTESHINPEHEKIIQEYNKLVYSVKPEAIKLLREVKAYIAKAYEGNTDKALASDPMLIELLGLQKSDAEIRKNTEGGKAIGKKGAITNLLDNLEFIEEGGLHFNYESAINQRIHVMQTILDFQGDKYMARQILQGGSKAKKADGRAKRLLLNVIADELKWDVETVENPTDKMVLNYMKTLETTGTIPFGELPKLSKHLKLKSPFKALSLLQALLDVQKAKGGAVTTNYQVESDATASGVVNTLLNLSGHPNVQRVLKLLGIGENEKGTDPYEFIAGVLKDLPSYETHIQPVLEELKDVGLDARAVAKYPIMKWFYGQMNTNNNADMGESIAADLVDMALYEYNQKAMDLINKILGDRIYVIDNAEGESYKSIADITDADQALIAKYYTDKIAKDYTNALNVQFQEVQGYRTKMGTIFTMLKNSKKWKGTIRTAMDALLEAKTPYKMSIKKLKQAVFQEDGTTYTTNKMMDNKTSFSVNLQHATDAALLLMSIRDILGDVVDSGVMTVHDAFYSDAETALKIMDRYNYYTKKAAIEYDYMDAALQELKDVIDEMVEGPTRDQYQRDYLIMKTENDILREEKAKYLEHRELNILGDWEIGNELAQERAGNPTTETKTKEATEKANTDQYKSMKAAVQLITTLAGNGTTGKHISQIVKVLEGLPVNDSHKKLLEKVVKAFTSQENRVKLMTDAAFAKTSKNKEDKTLGWSGHDYVVTMPSDARMEIVDRHTGHTINLNTADTLVEVLAHEIDHAIQYEYILQNIDKSNELKYLTRVLESLKSKDTSGMSEAANARLQYIFHPKHDTARQLSEFSSIIANELSVRDEILGLLESKTTIEKIKEIVSKMMKNVKEFFSKMTDAEVNELDINTEFTMKALEALDANARAVTITATRGVTPAELVTQKGDTGSGISMNPLTAVNDAIAKSNRITADWMIIFGDTLDEALSPKLMKAHMKLKHVSPIYKEAISLLKTGFYDSEIAQKMHYLLGLAGDVTDKVIKTSLTMFTSYQQESAKEREAMEKMDRQIEDTYSKKDRVKVHQLFADTGIANLISMPEVKMALFDGSKSVKELLEEVKAQVPLEKIAKLDEVANEWVNGNGKAIAVNVRYADTEAKEAYVYTTLKAISMIDGGEKILTGMDKDLRNWMMAIARVNKKLNDEINEMAKDYEGNIFSTSKQYNTSYEGSYSMDLHEKVYEYKLLSMAEMRNSKYSEENGWVVLREANGKAKGLIAREDLSGGRAAGIGLELNRYSNGAFLSMEQSQDILKEIEGMDEDGIEAYMNENRLVQEGNRFRVLLDKKTKVEKLGLIQNAAHSLYRTYIHNKELIQSESIRKLMLENGTERITTVAGMKNLERILRENDRRGVRGKLGQRTEVKPFVSIDYSAEELKGIRSFEELKKEYPMIAKYFKTPEGLTSFNGFNRKVSLVKRGISDVTLGHKNFTLFGNSDKRTLAQWENMFKKMVVLAKQKMIVTNPIKLVNDSISNIGILSMMDVGIIEILQGMNEGFKDYKEYAAERSKYVTMAMEARLADAMAESEGTEESKKKATVAINKRDKQLEKLKSLNFHDAFNYGFVQSYSTDLVIKEFDTIAGIQQDIDTFIDKYTHDKKGNPNKLFDAIKWWQNVGFGMDDVIRKMGEISKVKGTDTGTELIELADRLKSKKNDKESVSRYLSDYMGSPASEVVNYGSAYMVLSDALSKYVLAKHLMTQVNPRGERGNRKKYTREDAYSIANDTFIDYRTNLPAEIKALSDYGILMFPNFWIKIQRTIASLLKYHPVTSSVSYGIETVMGAESLNILNQNIVSKATSDLGLIANPIDHISLTSVLVTAG